MNPIINNVMSSGQIEIDQSLDLKYLAQKMWARDHNNVLIIKRTKPKCTICVFKQGRINILGCKSEIQASQAAKNVIKDLRRILKNEKLQLKKFKITNMNADAALNWKVNLQKFADDKRIVRNEKFSGVTYKTSNGVTANIYYQGQIKLTGAKSLEQIYQSFGQLKYILFSYKTEQKL